MLCQLNDLCKILVRGTPIGSWGCKIDNKERYEPLEERSIRKMPGPTNTTQNRVLRKVSAMKSPTKRPPPPPLASRLENLRVEMGDAIFENEYEVCPVH